MKQPASVKTMNAQECAAMLRALGDPTRLRILESLLSAEKCVGDLVVELKRTQPHISHHLRILRHARLIEGQREGKRICYRIVPQIQHRLKNRGEQGLDFGCCQLSFPVVIR